ncbi:hypothetical protein B0H14DRAFT_2594186 [Mycena olivaceomarginata]|nr:hypothetical protein B0H14DRAFT_2594186 [Mycena olivaceomarginata]
MLLFAAVLSLVLATPAIAFPSNLTVRDDLTCVHCGTTSDATLSDCQALVQPDTWAAAWAGDSNTCQLCVTYSPYPGRSATLDQEITRQRAASLLGCGATDVNKINGLEIAEADRSGVCLSNGDGCGDCFDDNDFEASCA